MNCREFQDRLLEQFGERILPTDLAKHVESCAECGKVWADLHTLTGEVGDNASFYPAPQEAELVAEVVDREIRVATQVTDVRPLRWHTYATVAAALVLVTATAMVWRLTDGRLTVSNSADTTTNVVDTTTDWTNTDSEMPSTTVSALLEEYTGRSSFSAGEELLGDLTDEEAAYLEAELKRGDLL